MQVAENGDLANWMIRVEWSRNGRRHGSRCGVKRVIVLMEHTARGEPKFLRRCTLPLTGKGVVDNGDHDLASFTIAGGRTTVTELAPGVSPAEIRDKTEGIAHHRPKPA